MAKKLLIPLCLLLVLLFSVQAYGAEAGPRLFTEETISFASYTEGAEAAFDGDKETGYAGSITGMFEKRSVLMGITIRASAPVVNLRVKGSENGVDWYELYYRKSFATIAIFGSDGSGNISDNMCEEMYTYSLKYLRFEMEYGAISEITMRGYATDVDGYIAELDTSFGSGNGYTIWKDSYYSDYERMPYVVDHVIHSSTKGEVVTYEFLDSAQSQKYAYITMKAKGDAPLTQIALMHKNDKNTVRWDNLLVEGSVDGQNWSTILRMPSNLSEQTNLRARTLMMIDVPENTAYRYARISSTKGSISIGVMDLYTAQPTPQVPTNILKGWENDPYIEEDAPKETKAEATTAEAEEAPLTTTAAPSTEKQSGCGSSVAVGGMLAVLLPSAVWATKRKRKTK